MYRHFRDVLSPDKVLQCIKTAVALDPHNPDYRVYLGQEFQRQDMYEEMIEAYQAADSLYQEYSPYGRAFSTATPKINLGIYYAENDDYEKALRYGKESLRQLSITMPGSMMRLENPKKQKKTSSNCL